jgi:hypothetical protein
MSGSSQARAILTAIMNVLFFLAALLTVRIGIEFFGVLAMTTAGRVIVEFTDFLVLPLGVAGVRTPYGGIFDVEAAITVVALLLVEWALSVARTRA